MSASFDKQLVIKSEALLKKMKDAGLKLAAAESCTGGLISALVTEISGSSSVFDRGFITYSNHAKKQMLGVSEKLLAEFGAVSQPVAEAMAEGAISHSDADISVAVTGIAGPGGATAEKPVGLVYIAAARKDGFKTCKKFNFSGSRNDVRISAVSNALEMIDEILG